MSKLDEAIENADLRKRPISKLDRIIAALDPEDAKRLVEIYLPDRSYSSSQIVRALASLGFELGRTSVDAWRSQNVPR